MAGYGRPLKGKTRRVPITVYAALGMIEEIDKYVEERNTQQEAAYSRSDFYNETAALYLKNVGRLPEEDQEEPNRTESVPKKVGDRNNDDNINNLNNKSQGK